MTSLFAFASGVVRNTGCKLWFLDRATTSPASEPVYPLTVSENHRYFVEGRFRFLAGYHAVAALPRIQAGRCEDHYRENAGPRFAFAQVMLLGVGDSSKPNVYGEKPWRDDDPQTPNEAYFEHVDAVSRITRSGTIVLGLGYATLQADNGTPPC